MKQTKKFLSAFLAVLMLFSSVPLTASVGDLFTIEASAAEVVASGSAGTDATWTLDDEGTFTVSGTGNMYGYYYNDLSWHSYRSSIVNAVIEESVTSIGMFTFYNCTNLASVTIPQSVVSVGDRAFENCNSDITVYYLGTEAQWSEVNVSSNSNDILTNATMDYALSAQGTCGDNLTWELNKNGTLTISGTGAMYDYTTSSPSPWKSYNDSITSVIIEDQVTAIGNYAFYICSNIANLTIGNSVTSIGSHAFYACENITNLTIPDSVTSIGNSAFAQCWNLESVTIPDSVTQIGTYVFSGCESLESVTIPESITSLSSYAFFLCKGLKSVTIPDSVTFIDKYVFSGCSNLETIYYGGSIVQWNEIEITELNETNESLSSATIIYGVPSGKCGDSAYWVYDASTKTLTIGGTGATYDYYMGDETPWYYYQPDYVVVQEGITYIGTCALADLYELEGISLPDSLTEIGYRAFEFAEVSALTVPEKITTIPNVAFWGCTFETITLPAGLTAIQKGAFIDCYYLTTVYFEGTEEQWNSISIDNTSNENSAIVNVAHVIINKDTVEPTCAAVGHEAGEYCIKCQEYVSGGAEIAINPENHTSLTYKGEVSLSGNGTHTANCDGCNTAFAAESCSYAATCEEVCSVCNYMTRFVSVDEHSLSYEILTDSDNQHKVFCTNCSFCEAMGCTYEFACSEKCSFCGGENTGAEAHSGGKATCVAKAICSVCGESYGEVNANNHVNWEIRNYSKGNCVTDGYTGDYYCVACNALLGGGEPIPKATIDHTYEWIIDQDSTCSVEGSQHQECIYCGVTGETQAIPTSHKGGEATCISAAVCEKCGNAYGEVNPENHINTEIRNALESTNCYTNGYTGDTYCADCDTLLEEGTTTACANIHDYVDGKCQYCSKFNAVMYFDNSGVNWPTVNVYLWSDTNTYAFAWPGIEIYPVEGESAIYAVYQNSGSYWPYELLTYIIFNNSSRTQTADLDFVCCGIYSGSSQNIIGYRHSYVDGKCQYCGDRSCLHENTETRNAVSATCTVDGYTGETYCLDCETTIGAGETITATGEHAGGEATCIAAAICDTCGNAYGEVNADNHKNTETITGTPATCGTAGLTDGEKCLDCGETLTEQEEIPLSGHSEEIILAIDLTCTTNGYTEGKKCSVCEEILVYPVVIPATGHVKKDVVIYEPTCTNYGIIRTVCEMCDMKIEERKINALGHNDDNKDGHCDLCEELTCSCICHKTGFMGFIWKIIRFFQKLFKIEQYCDCGAQHW